MRSQSRKAQKGQGRAGVTKKRTNKSKSKRSKTKKSNGYEIMSERESEQDRNEIYERLQKQFADLQLTLEEFRNSK